MLRIAPPNASTKTKWFPNAEVDRCFHHYIDFPSYLVGIGQCCDWDWGSPYQFAIYILNLVIGKSKSNEMWLQVLSLRTSSDCTKRIAAGSRTLLRRTLLEA